MPGNVQEIEIRQNEVAGKTEIKNYREVEIEKEKREEAATETGKEIKGQVGRDLDPRKEKEADLENEDEASQKNVEVGQEIALKNVLGENVRKSALVKKEFPTKINMGQVYPQLGLEIKENPTKMIVALLKILAPNVGLALEVKIKKLVIFIQLMILKLRQSLKNKLAVKNIQIKI